MTPYEEGQRAFETGHIYYNENPYPEETEEYQQWLNGYMDADIQESGDCS